MNARYEHDEAASGERNNCVRKPAKMSMSLHSVRTGANKRLGAENNAKQNGVIVSTEVTIHQPQPLDFNSFPFYARLTCLAAGNLRIKPFTSCAADCVRADCD